ncbi:FtsH protease activity modulator HflK [Burkholderiaceae bacterium DAT-1]|nr:FtsH protease activity modulator HflK [Burkholderiaceae bacterium DAT-1]
MTQPDPQWGKKPEGGPPDLDEVFGRMFKRMSQFFGGKPGSQQPQGNHAGIAGGLTVAGFVLGAIYLSSGFYMVDAREEAIVLRFGKFVALNEAGPHWRLPWPIERHEIVRLSDVRSVEVGGSGRNESQMLTQDQNIVDVQLEVQYDIKDAKAFMFNNDRAAGDQDARDLVRKVAETSIREVVGSNKVDFVLREGRTQIAADTTRLAQSLLDNYASGIHVVKVNINDVQPPEEVQAAFADTVKAGQDKVKYKNEGQAYANSRLPEAEGVASRLLQEAEGHRQTVVARAEGDAARFRKVAMEYAKAPQVTRDRMYYDTMQQVLSSATKVVSDQKSGGGGNLIYLPLDKIMQMGGASAGSGATDSKPKEQASVVMPESLTAKPHDSSVRSEVREGR